MFDVNEYMKEYMRQYRLKNPNYEIKDIEKKKEKYQNNLFLKVSFSI